MAKLRFTKTKPAAIDEQTRKRTPGEYALVDGDEITVKVISVGSYWRAIQPTGGSSFGRPVSPPGLDSFRGVRRWVIENWGGYHDQNDPQADANEPNSAKQIRRRVYSLGDRELTINETILLPVLPGRLA